VKKDQIRTWRTIYGIPIEDGETGERTLVPVDCKLITANSFQKALGAATHWRHNLIKGEFKSLNVDVRILEMIPFGQ